MIRAVACSVLLFWSFVTTGNGAASYDSALSLYDQGQFVEAAKVATDLGTAAGDALAARALLLYAAHVAPEGEDVVFLERGEAAAARALVRDSDNVEAILHKVIALGYRARLEKPMAAHEAGYARTAKALLKRASDLDPDNPWVWATWGGWHGEIAQSAGSFFAGLLYGASAGKARESFRRAIKLAPDNPAIRVEYAKTLLGMGKDYRADARAVLLEASALSARNAFEEILEGQGRRLLKAMDYDDPSLKASLNAVTPFVR